MRKIGRRFSESSTTNSGENDPGRRLRKSWPNHSNEDDVSSPRRLSSRRRAGFYPSVTTQRAHEVRDGQNRAQRPESKHETGPDLAYHFSFGALCGGERRAERTV